MNEGFMSTQLGLPGMPGIAEDVMVARDIQLAEYTGGRYHVAHVSTAATVDAGAGSEGRRGSRSRARSLPITSR